MELTDAIYHRRAVREFTGEPVGREAIEKLIDAAIQAPSAMNLQPWAFAIVQDRAVLSRISTKAKVHMLRNLPPSSPLESLRGELADPSFDIFYGAPALIVICAAPYEGGEAAHGNEDCALAAENLMLAAYGVGLGTCWIGLSRPWLETADGKAELGIPANYTPVAPIILGKPKVLPPSHGRKKVEVFWHR